MPHGGARPNSGPKPKEPGGAEVICITLYARHRALLDAWARETIGPYRVNDSREANRSAAVRRMIEIVTEKNQ